MLIWLTEYLKHYYRAFSVFEYMTLRAIMASLTALIMTLWMGPPMIRWLEQCKVGQLIREDGPKSHLTKAGTPTMGGAMIILAIALSTLIWSNLANPYVWIVLTVMLLFALIGSCDDYQKLMRANAKGLSASLKFLLQSIVGLAAAVFLYMKATTPAETSLLLPFFKNIVVPLGFFYIILTYFVIVGTSNAVNLTDGLDGLAIMPIVLVGGALGIFAYVTGHVKFATYLSLPYIPGVEEMVVFCSALVGAGLGFLWFNTYPAQVFMGDVGSLALGAALGIVAVLVRQELVLLMMGGVFVAETVSVILQVGSFKLRGRRIFKMAPIHHHFELKGWPEPRVIVRFWIITVVLVLFGLATLKLR